MTMTAGFRVVLGQDNAVVAFLVVDDSDMFAVRSNRFHVFLNVQTFEHIVLPSLMGERLVVGHSSTDVGRQSSSAPCSARAADTAKKPGRYVSARSLTIPFFLTFLIAHATRAEDLMTARGHNALTNDAAIGRGISVIIPISVMVTAIPIWTNAGTYWANIRWV